MWPFALIALACIPLMGFATSMEMSRFLGEDIGNEGGDEVNSPGGIVVETLLNIGTVSALTMEGERFKNYEVALLNSEPNYFKEAISQGVLAGLSMFIQQWINGLQLWWGGWILFKYGHLYSVSRPKSSQVFSRTPQTNSFSVSHSSMIFLLRTLHFSFPYLDLALPFKILPIKKKRRRVQDEFFISWIA
jgi:hypothetical protein